MRRTILIAVIAALVGLVAFFPLRVAIDLSTGPTTAISARQVGGSVWNGRIGDLSVKQQSLGTFDISTRFLPLFLGRLELDAARLDAGDGPLSLRLVTGGNREGIIDAQGRLPIGDLVAPLPLDAVLLEDVTLLFVDGRCEKAEGSVSLLPSVISPIPVEGFSGSISCGSDGRGLAEFASERGGHRVLFHVDALGSIEAEARTRGAPPAMAAALQLLGYAPEGGELVLRTRVR